jgi:hypothetical protein
LQAQFLFDFAAVGIHNTLLRLVGKVKSVEGRKKTLLAEMWGVEVLTATCEGLFIDVPVTKPGV